MQEVIKRVQRNDLKGSQERCFEDLKRSVGPVFSWVMHLFNIAGMHMLMLLRLSMVSHFSHRP